MFSADVSMVERFSLFHCQSENLFHPRRIRRDSKGTLISSCSDLFLDFGSNGLQIDAHFVENINSAALPQANQTEQHAFGSNKMMVKTVGLFSRKRQDLLRPRRKVAHSFIML